MSIKTNIDPTDLFWRISEIDLRNTKQFDSVGDEPLEVEKVREFVGGLEVDDRSPVFVERGVYHRTLAGEEVFGDLFRVEKKFMTDKQRSDHYEILEMTTDIIDDRK